MKKITCVLCTVAFALLLCACGGGSSSIPDELVGHWSDGKTYSTFPIAEMDIQSDGTVTLTMDHIYVGKISGSDGKYKIKVEEGTGTLSDATVKEVKKSTKITAEMNSDGTLTVYVEAKGGYYYMGPGSEVFSKE